MVTYERKNAETKQRSKLSKRLLSNNKRLRVGYILVRKSCGKNISKEILHIRIKQVTFN